ncbi:hypothetical protein BGY98DRAFT_582047 [Russula aff. rugulosa BPL654]|nr:hypothetical protein BGY98DRAFT_582047 [Russula aff. rugulosa BPL654]
MKFSLTLPIILSTLYISFSQAQNGNIPSCAEACAEAAASAAGCDPTTVACVCGNDVFITLTAECVVEDCSATDAETAGNYWDAVCLS